MESGRISQDIGKKRRLGVDEPKIPPSTKTLKILLKILFISNLRRNYREKEKSQKRVGGRKWEKPKPKRRNGVNFGP
jgi:hypothetical protein